MKRIVFIHRDGLHEILGAADKAEIPVAIMEPIATSRGVVPFCSLVKEGPRAMFFKAPMVPQALGAFDARQQ